MANILITGSTGMIGKGIVLEAIQNPMIKSIVIINRTLIDIHNPKIKEIILKDFGQINSIKDELGKIDACFHCMGVSAVGMSEEQYMHLTFDFSKLLADLCFEISPGMTFNYVSGAGTDSSETGRQMWARVKGKTENYILGKGFEKCYMFRPDAILPENGIRSRTKSYNIGYFILRPLFPLLKRMNNVTTTTKLAKAMIASHTNPNSNQTILSNKKINHLAGCTT